jgi:hypothetical protein
MNPSQFAEYKFVQLNYWNSVGHVVTLPKQNLADEHFAR